MGDTIKIVEIHQMLDGSFQLFDLYDEKDICGIVTKKEMNKELNKLFKSIKECYKEYSDKGQF